MSDPYSIVGIDVGATLCKLARYTDSLETQIFSSDDTTGIQLQIERWKPQLLAATGGGAMRHGAEIAGVRITRVPEFEAWAQGAPILAGRVGAELPERYVLVSIGTGTSILLIEGKTPHRIGGTALGGGTLVGLGRLLLRAESFQEVAGLASRGDRRGVDLLVGDIYADGEAPLPPDLNAASFAKLDSTQREDLAHALTGLVGENIGLICGQLSQSAGTETVLYGGSTLNENPSLEQILNVVTLACGSTAQFLPNGAFCGAVGATALA